MWQQWSLRGTCGSSMQQRLGAFHGTTSSYAAKHGPDCTTTQAASRQLISTYCEGVLGKGPDLTLYLSPALSN